MHLMNFRLLLVLATTTSLFLSKSALAQEALVAEGRLVECSTSAVEFAMRVHKVTLDFSPRSLGYVESMMIDFHTRKFPFNKV